MGRGWWAGVREVCHDMRYIVWGGVAFDAFDLGYQTSERR